VLAGVSYEEQEDAGFGAAVINLIIIPALWVGNSALVFWVIRLFVMYDPKKRKAWGRYINEKRMARGLCWAYAGMEAALWVAHRLSKPVPLGRRLARKHIARHVEIPPTTHQ